MTAVLERPRVAVGRVPLHRLGAVATLGAALGHLPLAAAHASAAPAHAAALLVLAAVCLHCSRCLWRGGSPRSWGIAAAMSVAMLAAHAPGLLPAGHDHAHPGSAGLAVLVGGCELGVLALAAVASTRALGQPGQRPVISSCSGATRPGSRG